MLMLHDLNRLKSSLGAVYPVEEKSNDRLLSDEVTAGWDSGLIMTLPSSSSFISLRLKGSSRVILRDLVNDSESAANTRERPVSADGTFLALCISREECKASCSEEARWDYATSSS